VVRPLSRFAAAVALAFGLASSSSSSADPTIVNSLSELKLCVERTAQGQPIECLVTEQVRRETSGTAFMPNVFLVTLPTSRKLDLTITWAPGACFVWNHTGTSEPDTSSSPTPIFTISVPTGVLAGGRVLLKDPCIREQRNGVDGGAVATSIGGILVTGAGRKKIEIRAENPWIQIASKGSLGFQWSGLPVTSALGSDSDGDGLFEQVWFHDADGDGSQLVLCTGDATPDIACKAQGELLARDFIDDTNTILHRKLARGGVIDYPVGVFVGWPCWNPTTNFPNPLTHETSDNEHDGIGDDSVFLSQCSRDPDGAPLFVISAQAAHATLRGRGGDPRRLERGRMDDTFLRNQGTYFVTDMGPWDNDGSHNRWNGFFGNLRFISGGFHGVVGPLQHTGESSGAGDSKGWGEFLSFDPNFDSYIGPDTTTVCVRNQAGTVGTTHSSDGWVASLIPGDLVIVPIQTGALGVYTQHEVIVRETPSVVCGTNGLAVTFGGSITNRAATEKTYPAFSNLTPGLVGSGQKLIHARSNYQLTDFAIERVTIAPSDPWNEFGGRCRNDTTDNATDDGAVMRATEASTGFVFKLTPAEGGGAPYDDSNYDLSCDTHNLVGLWGGGKVAVRDSVLAFGHMFWVDGGGSGGEMTIERDRFIYGNGREVMDGGNQWRMLDNIVEQSVFNSNVFTDLGAHYEVDGLVVRNSKFNQLTTLTGLNEGARFRNITIESSAHGLGFFITCGTKFVTIDGLYTTGDAIYNGGNYPASVMLDCDAPSNPIQHNVIKNVVEDVPGRGLSNEQMAPILFNANAATNGTLGPWAGIVNNVISEVRQIGIAAGADTGEEGCLFAAYEMDSDDPQAGSPGDADDGESTVFSTNFFSSSSVSANGRAFCITNGLANAAIDREALGTGAIPQSCGVLDGGTAISYGVCR
jgi:hypothetical protein